MCREVKCHVIMMPTVPDLVSWVIAVCVCLCFPQGLAKPCPSFLCLGLLSSYVMCSALYNLHTLTGSSMTCMAPSAPLLFLSFTICPLACSRLFALLPHSPLHVCICGPMPACMYAPSDPCSLRHTLNSAALA